jgi:hypothetical protein
MDKETVNGVTRDQMRRELIEDGAIEAVADHYVALAFGDLTTDTPDSEGEDA